MRQRGVSLYQTLKFFEHLLKQPSLPLISISNTAFNMSTNLSITEQREALRVTSTSSSISIASPSNAGSNRIHKPHGLDFHTIRSFQNYCIGINIVGMTDPDDFTGSNAVCKRDCDKARPTGWITSCNIRHKYASNNQIDRIGRQVPETVSSKQSPLCLVN